MDPYLTRFLHGLKYLFKYVVMSSFIFLFDLSDSPNTLYSYCLSPVHSSEEVPGTVHLKHVQLYFQLPFSFLTNPRTWYPWTHLKKERSPTDVKVRVNNFVSSTCTIKQWSKKGELLYRTYKGSSNLPQTKNFYITLVKRFSLFGPVRGIKSLLLWLHDPFLLLSGSWIMYSRSKGSVGSYVL